MEREKKGAFTLLEIMAVVLIIGLLSVVVAVNVVGHLEGAKASTTRTQLEMVSMALDSYQMHNGSYPTEEQGLAALLKKPRVPPEPRYYPPGGFLRRRSALADGWDRPLVYHVPGRQNPHSFDLCSYGRDGSPGGDELDSDICNWDHETAGQ